MVSRNIYLTGVAFVVATTMAGAASAADVNDSGVYYDDQTAYVTPPADWTGFYLGAMLGYNWGEFDTDTGTDVDVNGVSFGGFAGYNWQSGAFVFGAEVDLAMTSVDGSKGGMQGDVDWMATLRGRVGYTVDRHMLYGTAGVGFAAGDLSSDDNSHAGIVAGAGVESMLNRSLSARVEYLYSNFNEQDYSTFDSDLGTHSVRGGVGYHF